MKFELRDRQSVLSAIEEYDRVGRPAFLEKYGYRRARKYILRFGSKEYDPKAIVGAAYQHENPTHGPLKYNEHSGGEGYANDILRSLGFIVEPINARDNAGQDGEATVELQELAADKEENRYFEAANLDDQRQRTMREIVERRGQQSFRRKLIEEHHGRCVVTGCDAVAALEAAHIIPYLGPQSDHVSNGLLLRADIHTLFDLDLIRIHPESLKVVLAPPLRGTCYGEIEGRPLSIAAKRGALRRRWRSRSECR
jgi:hypothetical protein